MARDKVRWTLIDKLMINSEGQLKPGMKHPLIDETNPIISEIEREIDTDFTTLTFNVNEIVNVLVKSSLVKSLQNLLEVMMHNPS